jgi:hypothetical protein
MQLAQRQQQQLQQQQSSSWCIQTSPRQLSRLSRRNNGQSLVHVKHPTHHTAVARATTGAAVTALGQSGAAVTAAVADPCLDLDDVKGKAVGSLLAAMCGNALGAQVEPEKVSSTSRLSMPGSSQKEPC